MNFQTTKRLNKEHNNISDLVRYQDHHYIILDKKAGIPVQPDLTQDISLKQLGEIYTKKNLYPITRLDRPASGLTFFAKSSDAAKHAQSVLNANGIEKSYLAIVEGKVKEESLTLKDFLLHDKKNKKARVYEKASKDIKEAILHYTTIQVTDRYTILDVKIDTGRFHQIRSQLAHMGNPIKGDVKYGARRSNKDRSIHLICYELKMRSKSNQKEIHCFAQMPTTDGLWKIAKESIHGEG